MTGTSEWGEITKGQGNLKTFGNDGQADHLDHVMMSQI